MSCILSQRVEDPGNHSRQRQLQCGSKPFLRQKYPQPRTSIPHQDSGGISISGNRDRQQPKRLLQTHPGQYNTQRIQRQNLKLNCSTAENDGDTSTTGLHHGHNQQQQWHKWQKKRYICLSPTTYPGILLVTRMVQAQ